MYLLQDLRLLPYASFPLVLVPPTESNIAQTKSRLCLHPATPPQWAQAHSLPIITDVSRFSLSWSLQLFPAFSLTGLDPEWDRSLTMQNPVSHCDFQWMKDTQGWQVHEF